MHREFMDPKSIPFIKCNFMLAVILHNKFWNWLLMKD